MVKTTCLSCRTIAPSNTLPELGTRVIYNVEIIATTNRPKAVVVELDLVENSSTGTINKHKGKFGFINQDNGKGDLFVVPLDCLPQTLPAVGTRVIYNVVMEEKSRALKAVDVRPELVEELHVEETCTGTMSKDKGNFGFIRQDNGGGEYFRRAL